MRRIFCLALSGLLLLLCACAEAPAIQASKHDEELRTMALDEPESVEEEPTKLEEPEEDVIDPREPARELILPEPSPGEEWRRAFYDIAVENLEYGGRPLVDVWWYRPSGGQPVLRLRYAPGEDDEGWQSFSLAYRWNGSSALLVYEGRTGYFEVNDANGNIQVGRSDGETVHEIYTELTPGGDLPLYQYPEGNAGGVYNYLDSRLYGYFEFVALNPLKSYAPTLHYDVIEVEPWNGGELELHQKKLRLADFLLGYYTPKVPQSTPKWVAEYIAYVHNNYHWVYNGESSMIPHSIILFAPLTQGGAPAMLVDVGSYSRAFGAKLYYDTNGLHTLPEGLHGGFDFALDANGKPLVAHIDYNVYTWYAPTEKGLEYLYVEGANPGYDASPVMFCDRYIEYWDGIPRDNETELAWLEEQRAQAMPRYGYAAPIAWVDWEEIELPQCKTWAELETALIEALCTYAGVAL